MYTIQVDEIFNNYKNHYSTDDKQYDKQDDKYNC